MKRTLVLAAAAVALATAGCSMHHQRNTDVYANPFYAKYLDPANAQDQQIRAAVDAARTNPDSAAAHNALGQLLLQKGFPKDAEREFERAVDADSHFYAGWYNLGLVRASRGEIAGARHALRRTVHYRPGHAAALFQLGLLEERAGNVEAAIDLYAKAYSINHLLLDVHVNPRILDSHLTDVALVKMYPKEHNRESIRLQPTPLGYYTDAAAPPPTAVTTTGGAASPSPQAPAQNIVTPAAPVTDPSMQKPPAPRP